jgi:hypothetical protein
MPPRAVLYTVSPEVYQLLVVLYVAINNKSVTADN